jgi:hypothetical protein
MYNITANVIPFNGKAPIRVNKSWCIEPPKNIDAFIMEFCSYNKGTYNIALYENGALIKTQNSG